jgi:hypothetical protein
MGTGSAFGTTGTSSVGTTTMGTGSTFATTGTSSGGFTWSYHPEGNASGVATNTSGGATNTGPLFGTAVTSSEGLPWPFLPQGNASGLATNTGSGAANTGTEGISSSRDLPWSFVPTDMTFGATTGTGANMGGGSSSTRAGNSSWLCIPTNANTNRGGRSSWSSLTERTSNTRGVAGVNALDPRLGNHPAKRRKGPTSVHDYKGDDENNSSMIMMMRDMFLTLANARQQEGRTIKRILLMHVCLMMKRPLPSERNSM